MLAKAYSAQVSGLRADFVIVEADISKGLHSFNIVGLGDKAVTEARDRISAAIKNSGFKSPQKGNKKVIIALAPANLKKEGTVFDLAIALATLAAQNELEFDPSGKLFLGELALDGSLRPIHGSLLIARAATDQGVTDIYLPAENATEAALVHSLNIYPVQSLNQLVKHLDLKQQEAKTIKKQEPTAIRPQLNRAQLDFSDIVGQAQAKRGLEIAAAGGHNIAMYGPPGTGKTMLGKALAGILPPLSFDEILEVTGIYSTKGLISDEELITSAPVRSPHHTSSHISLIGGGTWPTPGEITLAHRGVLFLDEFPEFEKRTIEALRQPLEDRVVSIARSKGSILFPANFILVATLNPCPCGYRGSSVRECVCAPAQIFKYERKISGPIIDRIDLWLEVPTLPPAVLKQSGEGEPSAKIQARVVAARDRQAKRFASQGIKLKLNSEMGPKELKKLAPLDDETMKLLETSATRLGLSARAYHRVIKIARTIADLAGSERIKKDHLLEALQYRPRRIFS
jgi:magnesium chelatase family protein